MRDSFVFYRSFMEAIEDLPAEDFKRCVVSLTEYALDDKEPDASGVVKTFFKLAKPQIDANNKRFKNGFKGGAPLGNQNARKQPKTTEKQPKNNLKQPNVNVNDNVNDNDIKISPKILKWGGKQRAYDFEELTEEIKIK